jgi:hypothetical protein
MLKEETLPVNKKSKDIIKNFAENMADSVQNLKYNPNIWGHLNDSK